jgi:ribosomal protein S27E
MILDSGQFEELMRRTQATRLRCLDCGTEFTFHDGAQAAIASGVHNKVKCASCGTIYETEVQFSGIGLVRDGRTEWFSAPQS